MSWSLENSASRDFLPADSASRTLTSLASLSLPLCPSSFSISFYELLWANPRLDILISLVSSIAWPPGLQRGVYPWVLSCRRYSHFQWQEDFVLPHFTVSPRQWLIFGKEYAFQATLWLFFPSLRISCVQIYRTEVWKNNLGVWGVYQNRTNNMHSESTPRGKKKVNLTAFPICKEIENNYMVAGSFFVFIIIEEGCRAEWARISSTEHLDSSWNPKRWS